MPCTDYTVRMFLAVHEPRASTVNDVAESYGISRNSKLTLNLKTLGLYPPPGPFRRHSGWRYRRNR